MIATRDPERTNFLVENTSELQQFKDYTEWQEIPLEREQIRDLATGEKRVWLEQILSMLFPQMTNDLPTDGKGISCYSSAEKFS